jgi:hypothetical protein
VASDAVVDGLTLMEELALVPVVLPELAALRGVEQLGEARLRRVEALERDQDVDRHRRGAALGWLLRPRRPAGYQRRRTSPLLHA